MVHSVWPCCLVGEGVKNPRRGFKQKYWVKVPGKWWCGKCRRFVDYEPCGGVHQLSSSQTVWNVKKLRKLLLKELQSNDEISVTRWIKWSPVYGYLTQEFIYR